ncbi:MAG TPA: hypothetical protein VEF06_04510 [Bryobacteraceae bacterium]|nr:hypothetical protein [Bryobacteraceae bacterium]
MPLDTLEEIERAIDALTPREREKVYVWLDEHHPQSIDTRIASDLAAGRLDDAIQRALDEEKSGSIRPLQRMHRTTRDFRREYDSLPPDIRERADKQFSLLKANPQHPSLQFKKAGTRLGPGSHGQTA